MKIKLKSIISISLLAFILTSSFNNIKVEKNWEYLFNGKNLDNWGIKIKNHEFGDNYKNTFKVENNILKVSYEGYDSFQEKFGHIFYMKKKFKNYHLSLKYRFSGDHLKGAPAWSIRNSGIMLHCQDPNTMLIDQDFPVSAEVQLLGGLGDGERTTANICSPGTDVDINNKCIAPLSFSEFDYKEFQLLLLLYVCRRWEGEPMSMEKNEIKWVKANMLRQFKMPPADDALIYNLQDLF